MILAALPRGRFVQDGGPVTAQLWKRGDDEARVTFRCPWCDVVGVSGVHGKYEQPRAIWLLVACPNVPCARGVMIRVPTRAAWTALDTGDDGMLLDDRCVMPVMMAKADARKRA